MGRTPVHRRSWRAARHLAVLATVFALIVAPLVVVLSHGPAGHADVTEEIAAKGHAHDVAGHGHQGVPLGGHNPADHDHQLQALICQATNALRARPVKTHRASSDLYRILAPEAPRRPPRSV